jgi:hypothetical protein
MRIGKIMLAYTVLVLLTAVTSFTADPPVRNMEPTIYNDGKSCPHGCDAHVVFNPAHNGTRNAFSPESNREHPVACALGQTCTICFSEDEASCMTATYRGGGPAVGRFDFTPAFYQENCPKPTLPAAFARQCHSAEPALARLRGQINCVVNPTHERCRTIMEAAARRKSADDPLYAECKSLGQTAFNQKYRRQPERQRILDCAYERQSHGGGGRWHRLLDGACLDGNYAGRDGLDCCSGNIYEGAMLGRECRGFFVNP